MIKCFLVRLLPLSIMLLYLFPAEVLAGKGVPVIQVLDGSRNQLQVDSAMMVMDSAFFNPSYNAILVKPYKVLNYVTLKINEATPFYIQSDFTASVRLRIVKTLANLSTVTVDTTLTVNYKADSIYTNKSTYHFNDAYKVEVKVLSATTNAGWNAWNILMVENQLVPYPVFTFSCTENTIQSVAMESLDYDTGSDEIMVSWGNVVEADKYDLEWTYIDSVAMVSGNYNTGGNPDPVKIFDNSASRATLTGTQYKIPLLYDGSGSLFFRVRPVQEPAPGLRIEANWSSEYSGGLGRFDFAGHQRNLNWQSTISYAEDGKRKVVMQYFDGSLRSRQTVTKDNTTNTTVVAESIYDYQGRPVIQVLPAPTMDNIVKYSQNFNLGLNGSAYDYTHFDDIIDSSYYCIASAEAMKIDSGAARYYSTENPLSDSGFHKFIPDAQGYPFTETVYTPDNTGRISAQGGVGPKHRITSGHETKYYYGTPDQKVLDALFGTDVGHYTHYFKTMVRDANGQYSVSYTDMHGRTIATALAGVLPDSIKLDTLSERAPRMVSESLADSSNMVIKDLVMENSKSLLVSLPGNHTFTYELNPQSLAKSGCNDEPFCYDCLYDLQITITDDCNNQKLGGRAFDTLLHNFSVIDTSCANPAQGFSFSFTKFLEEGNYEVTKKLSVSKPALEYYRDTVFKRRNTCTTEEEMISYRKTLEYGSIQCKPSCDACIDSLGTWSSFRDKYMLQAGISPQDSAEYRAQALQAFISAEADCKLLCDSITETDQIYNAMLMDMTAPSGQYANPDDTTDIYSVFYAEYDANDNLVRAPRYSTISGYVDEEGNPDYIFDEEAQALVAPQELSPQLFAAKFKLSWAKALLPYHPEYCKLDKYLQMEASNTWNRRFEKTTTYADALAKGYLNPANITGSKYIRFYGTFGMIDRDPAPGILGGSALSLFQNAMQVYTAAGTNSATAATNAGNIWALASAMAKCAQQDNSCYTGRMIIDSAFFNMCTADLDAAWLNFRQMYLDTKQHLIDSIFTHGICSTAVTADVLIAASHTPNFGEAKQAAQDYGITIPTNSSELPGLQQSAKSQASGYASDNCSSYIAYWVQQLTSYCTSYPMDSINDVIIPRLLAVCKKGTDLTHPFGSSDIAPDSTNTYKSFQEVITAYNASHGITDVYCNAYGITTPKPYNSQAVLGNQPVNGNPDSCACSRVTEIFNKYQAVQADYSSFSDYLQQAYNTTVSQTVLDSLRQKCATTGTTTVCTGSTVSLSLPPLFQCNSGDVCVTCEQYQSNYNNFTATYPGVIPVMDSLAVDTTQLTKNRFFEQFMNYRLGFSKSVNEYLQFAESCSERLHQDSANNGLLDTCRQFTFVKSYGGNGTDVFFDLKQTFDGGYILTGTTTSFGNGGTDGYIVKTDSRGNVIWSKTYGGSGDDDLMKIRQTPDSGYIAIGTTKSYHQAQGEIFVVKIDAAGSVTWARGFAQGTTNGEIGFDIIQTSDGGYALAGVYNSGAGVSDIEVLKLTAGGAVSWAKKFGSTSSDNLGGLTEVADTLYLGGLAYSSAFTKIGGGSPTFTYYDALLVKINKSNGNIIWAKTYDIGNTSNWVSYIQPSSTGIHLDITNMVAWSSSNAYNVSFDLDRNGIPSKSIRLNLSSVNNSYVTGSMPTFDGGYITGHLRLDTAGNTILQKINAGGAITWSNSLKIPGSQYLRQAIQTRDSSFAAAGVDKSNALFIKTNTWGETYCADSSLAYDTASMAVTVYNISLTPATLSFSNVSISVSGIDAATVQTDQCAFEPCPADTCNRFTFVRTFGGSGTDNFVDIRQTFDKGYIMAGTTTSFGKGGTDAYVVKTDSKGNIQWSKTYGKSQDDEFRKIKPTSDSGYIAIGTTKSYHQATGEIFVVKIKNNGSVDWAKGFAQGTANGEWGFDIFQTSEGGYVLVGTYNLAGGVCDIEVLKLTGTGAISWGKKFGAAGLSDNGGGVLEHADTIVVAGFTQGASLYDGVLVKMNKSTGAIIWSKRLDMPRANWISNITQNGAGYQLTVSHTDGYTGGNAQASVLDVDRNGNTTRHVPITVPSTSMDGIGGAVPTADGGFIATQVTFSGAYSDVVIDKFDPSWGAIKWRNTLTRSGNQYLYSILQNADNSFAGAGADGNNGLFIKTNSTGYVKCNDSMVYDYPALGIAVANTTLSWTAANLTFSNTDINVVASDAATIQTDVCSLDPCLLQDIGPTLCGRAEPLFPPVSLDSVSNCMDSTFFAVSSGRELFKVYKDSLNNNFDSSYRTLCMQAYRYESFTVTHQVSEYHYTLYYYDQAGSLVRTVPPAGVDLNMFDYLDDWSNLVAIARDYKIAFTPNHVLKTDYRYNTLNQVVAQQTPDAGISQFWYDRLGRLAVAQNAKQKAGSGTETGRQYSYTLYDGIGRITEVGQITNATGNAMTDIISRSPGSLDSWLTASVAGKEQITTTAYDQAYAGFTGISPQPIVQRNLRNRVSYMSITHGANPAQYNQASFYTYDALGNVDTLLQDYGASDVTPTQNVMNVNNNRFKRIVYQFDLVSGKVNTVAYQPGQADQFYHRYTYDAENRIILAETSNDSIHWEKDARYQYYKHGPLARSVLGEQLVQGLDYAYTLQGWLKGVNSSSLEIGYDMGRDGDTTWINRYVARDAFGFNLGYYTGDYTPINNAVTPFPGYSAYLGAAYKPLFNGNISSMAVNIGQFNNPMLYAYTYDQLNRLTGMNAHTGFNQSTNSWSGLTATNDYKERVEYDPNGNITKYQRNGVSSVSLAMDNLTYHYNKDGDGRLINNRLNYVQDAISSGNYTTDIDNQSFDNYKYDEIGNLTKDNAEGITSISWNVYGKIQEIQRNATDSNPTVNIKYTYDASGNRISKKVTDSSNNVTYTWYVRDAQGNVMSTYKSAGTGSTLSSYSVDLSEQHLFGSSRLGIMNRNVNMKAAYTREDIVSFYRGYKHYELSNHLGNVLVTITDKKYGVSTNGSTVDNYTADVSSANDYYPGGMNMVNRNYSVGKYRYGFNGQERSIEINGNSYTAEFWEYDARVGRRWNVDPVAKYYEGAYSSFANNPVYVIDPKGRDTTLFTKYGGQKLDAKSGGTKNAIYIVDDKYDTKYYSTSELWSLASPLKYEVGKDTKYKGVTGQTFRVDHPLFKKGYKAGDQVYLEDLMDLTDEFQNIVIEGIPIFEKLKSMKHKEFSLMDERADAFSDMVTDNAKYDLKSRKTEDGTPSYAAVVIGEWSILNGTLRRYDDYGNISYSVFGLSAGFTKLELLKGSNLNQELKALNPFGKTKGGDEDRDKYMMQTGFYNYSFYLNLIKGKSDK